MAVSVASVLAVALVISVVASAAAAIMTLSSRFTKDLAVQQGQITNGALHSNAKFIAMSEAAPQACNDTTITLFVVLVLLSMVLSSMLLMVLSLLDGDADAVAVAVVVVVGFFGFVMCDSILWELAKSAQRV